MKLRIGQFVKIKKRFGRPEMKGQITWVGPRQSIVKVLLSNSLTEAYYDREHIETILKYKWEDL